MSFLRAPALKNTAAAAVKSSNKPLLQRSISTSQQVRFFEQHPLGCFQGANERSKCGGARLYIYVCVCVCVCK